MKVSEIDTGLQTPALNIMRILSRRKKEKRPGLSVEEFERELNNLQKTLYNYIAKSLNFSEDAGDVYQESVTRAFRYLKSYKTELSSVKTWLFRIATNEIRRYYGKNREETLSLDSDSVPAPPSVQAESEVSKIFEAASGLSSTQRTVFFLFYDQEFSIREISEITGLKEGNIKTVLSHARGKIREVLK